MIVLEWIETIFARATDLIWINMVTLMCPDFMIRRQIPRKLLTAIKSGLDEIRVMEH